MKLTVRGNVKASNHEEGKHALLSFGSLNCSNVLIKIVLFDTFKRPLCCGYSVLQI